MDYEAIRYKNAWPQHILGSSLALEERLGPKAWQFSCGVCEVQMHAGVSTHICSRKHQRRLQERLSSFPDLPPGGGHLPPAHIAVKMNPYERPLVQKFELDGERGALVLFNHITGGMVEYTRISQSAGASHAHWQ